VTTYLIQMKLHETLIKTGLKVDGDCYVLQTNTNKWSRSPVPISHPLTILLLLTKNNVIVILLKKNHISYGILVSKNIVRWKQNKKKHLDNPIQISGINKLQVSSKKLFRIQGRK
jgi:hypothetical protein